MLTAVRDSITHLGHQVVIRRRVRVESVEVVMPGKVRERLPGRLVDLNLEGRHADRALVPDGTASHHRDAVHAAESQLSPVLKREELCKVRLPKPTIHYVNFNSIKCNHFLLISLAIIGKIWNMLHL